MMLRRSFFASILICAAVLSAPVRAQQSTAALDADAAARRAFEAGRDAYDHGAFAAALRHFEQAYALHPSPELLYNVGRSADSDGQPSRAIAAYASYLESFPVASNRDFVQARLDKMRALERDRASVQAPLPSVAQSERADHARAPGAAVASDDGPARPLRKRAWFWTGVGALVVGGVVASVLLATRERGPQRAMADEYVVTPEVR